MSYKMPVLAAQEEKEEDQIAAEINALEGVLPDTNQTLEESLAAAQDYDPYKRLRDQATRRRVPASDRYQSYVDKLTPMFSQSPPTGEQRFYDLASDLGSSLLSADPTEGVFRPLGRGFGNFNERLRKQSESERAINQSVAMKAFELAMADEKAAADYLNQIDLAIVKHGATAFDPLVFEVDELNAQGEKTGERVQVLIDPRNEKQVEAIQKTDRNPIVIKDKGTNVNINQRGETNFDVQRGENLAAWEKELFAEATAGRAQENLVDLFISTVTNMKPDEFGVVASKTLNPRRILNELGIRYDDSIEDSIMVQTLGTRIAMAMIQQTKGAISEMEMKLFMAASPGLLSTRDGALRQAMFLKRIAERPGQRSTDYAKAVQEGGLFDNAETVSDKWLATMSWSENWYKENPFLTLDERAELQEHARQETKEGKLLRERFFEERESGGPGFENPNILFTPQ